MSIDLIGRYTELVMYIDPPYTQHSSTLTFPPVKERAAGCFLAAIQIDTPV